MIHIDYNLYFAFIAVIVAGVIRGLLTSEN